MWGVVCAQVVGVIGADKSADFGIIIAGVEIVEAKLAVVDIAAVAQGVDFANSRRFRAGGGKDIALSCTPYFYYTAKMANRQGV